MTQKLSQNALMKALNDLKLDPCWQKETDQIYILWKISQREVPVFFGLRSGDTLLQAIAYLPYDLQQATLGQVARLLHMLNHQIDMPGFGMDEEQKLMFYRTVMPCPGGEFNENLFALYLATARIAVETFMDAIAMVAGGVTTVENVLEQAKRKKQP